MNKQIELTTQSPPRWAVPLVVIMAWLVTAAIVSSRVYFLQPYAAVGVLPPVLEPFGIPSAAIPACLALALVWTWLASRAVARRRAITYALVACVPLVPWLPKLFDLPSINPLFVEAIWLPAWTGLSFAELLTRDNMSQLRVGSSIQRFVSMPVVLWSAMSLCAVWWFAQLSWYHANFLLGYNDYGHFLQRLSNTLGGHGWLIETPVLPRFWDHFNPGLLCVLPAWALWPDVTQSFIWQSGALSISSYLIYRIALALRHERSTSVMYGLAWLAQPAVGQMNLAFSYGWHPITFAIPLLLGTIWSLLRGKRWLALVLCLLALSMEEGVFVVVALTAFVCGAWKLWKHWSRPALSEPTEPPIEFFASLSVRLWFVVWLASTISFVLIYKFSGLAEFQTGRFVSLGNNTGEIILSPVLRPQVFWGALLSTDRWIYLLLLWLPCGLPALRRGWYYLLPTLLPLLVLMVWGHPPAHCIAFQYASTLLPLFWLSALTGSVRCEAQGSYSRMQCAVTALVTGIALSLYLGQLPFSNWTLLDVDSQTYGAQDGPRRRAAEADGIWLTGQLQDIRKQNPRCLTTGRIAAHLVGMPDIETVGQYIERKERLSRLDGRSIPIRHYQWIVLDRIESFQQTPAQVKAIEEEARTNGFEEFAVRFDIVILRRREE